MPTLREQIHRCIEDLIALDTALTEDRADLARISEATRIRHRSRDDLVRRLMSLIRRLLDGEPEASS